MTSQSEQEKSKILQKIIDRVGGSVKTAYYCRVSQGTVVGWLKKGVPLKYWAFFMKYKFATLEELFAASQEVVENAKKAGVYRRRAYGSKENYNNMRGGNDAQDTDNGI